MLALNTKDGWETIVNANADVRGGARQRIAAAKRKKKLAKCFSLCCVLAAGGILAVMLGAFGAAAAWLSIVMAVFCIAGSCFALGEYATLKGR